MRDKGRIIIGLIVFLILISFPVWYNVATGKATYKPELTMPTNSEQCVRETEWMTAYHMDLLNEWRDQVVREGVRYETDEFGRTTEMSLTHTCLDCHTERSEFCDKCHDYMSVEPYCWDCHVEPKEAL
jgi:hypothetical protein